METIGGILDGMSKSPGARKNSPDHSLDHDRISQITIRAAFHPEQAPAEESGSGFRARKYRLETLIYSSELAGFASASYTTAS